MDPEAKSMFFILSQEVNWQLSVTYKSLTNIYIKFMFPALTYTSQKIMMERWTMHLPEKWK